jgi:hypothetical protein
MIDDSYVLVYLFILAYINEICSWFANHWFCFVYVD